VALIAPGETIGSIAIGALTEGAWPSRDEWIGAALVVCGATVVVTARSRRSPGPAGATPSPPGSSPDLPGSA
jgi:hypothetical protein